MCFFVFFSYRIHCLSGWMSRKTSLDVATRKSRLLQPCGSTISSVVLSGCSGRKEIIAELHPGYSIIWLGSHTPISPYSPLTLTKHISLYSFKEVRGSDLALCPGKEEMNFVEYSFFVMDTGTYFLLYNRWLLP